MKIFFIFSVLAFFLIAGSVYAYPGDWPNSDWQYAKMISVYENSGNDLTDYQILLEIDYNDSMQPDFDDLRFTYYNASSIQEFEIPYWIQEKIDGNYADVWIKVPFVPSNSNATVIIYYGNENAESKSNGSSVFPLFDDFNDLNQWTIVEKSPGSEISISNIYNKTGETCVKIFGNSDGKAVLKRTDIPHPSYIYEIYFYDTKENLPEDQIQTFETDADEPGGQFKNVGVGYFESSNVKNYTARYGLILNNYDTKFPSTLGWHLFGIYWNGTNYFIYIDNKLVSKSPDAWEYGLLHPLRSVFGDWWGPQKSTFYWDTYKVRKFTPSEPTYIITDLPPPEPPEPQVPEPTDRSLILANSDWKNIISATPTRLPVIVSDSLTAEVEKFINEYGPDYIYTLGFSLDLNNSYEIQYTQIPELFFPDVTQAVYAADKTKAILGSNLAYYLGLPIIFEQDLHYEIIDIESKTIEDIQDLYVQKLKENGDNTDYLVLANFDSAESEIAGYLAGIRRGFIIPIFNSSSWHALEQIKESIAYLGSNGMFSESLDYKKGGPLYLAILGNGSSVSFWKIPDIGSEIFDDKDGDFIYSDIMYGDVNRDGRFELATGRLDGLTSKTTLNLARQRLPVGNKAVLIGEYRHGKFADMLFAFGGMSQVLILDKMILKSMETERIVEKRIDAPRINGDMDDLLKDVAKIAVSERLGRIFGWFWKLPSFADLGITVMYSLFEFDWDPWLSHPGGFPDHLPVIDGNLNEHFHDADVVGYFGLGDKYWTIPPEDRNWLELYLNTYGRSTNFTEINFSGFLYDDHDISAESEIKRQVQAQGGEVLGSSGVIHDPYTTITSASFFNGLESGKSLGEAFSDVMNVNPADRSIAAVLYPSHPLTKSNAYLCVKDLIERILFADPAYKPVSIRAKTVATEQSFSVTPSGSFSITADVKSNYTIQNRSLTVFNADSYLTEQERPVIPVFVREFVLPTNSILESVKVKPAYLRERGLEKNIIYNDSYYTNYTVLLIDCMSELGLGNEEPSEHDEAKLVACIKEKAEPVIAYPYPNETYWFTTQELLDDRQIVYVYLPAIIHDNRFVSRVLEEAEITVEYDAQLEMDVETNDIGLDQDENLQVILFNQGEEVSGELFIWADGNNDSWDFKENVTIPFNSSVAREFSFKPSYKGTYSVKVLFVSESITIGPRNSYFKVGGLDFELGKKFVPQEVRLFRKKYFPPINFPEIRIRSTDVMNITSIEISDAMPAGFRVPGYNSFRRIETEGETFETDERIPVFVFLASEKGKGHGLFGKKLRMLKREYYNASIIDGRVFIKTEDFSRTNFGRDIGKEDVLVIKYLILSDKAESQDSLTTETNATAFSGEVSLEKAVLAELRVK